MLLFITIFVLAFLAALNVQRILFVLVRVWVWGFVQANSRAKCPGCGVKAKHKVTWAQTVSKLIHVCSRCTAAWAEDPMVNAERWRLTAYADPEEQVDDDGVRTTKIQHAQREPVVMKDFKPTGSHAPRIISGGCQ